MKTFLGIRTSEDGLCHVFVCDEERCTRLLVDNDASIDSSGQFNWGYGGAGPRALAWAILYETCGDVEVATILCQRFKWAFVAKLPKTFWILDSLQIEAFLVTEVSRVDHQRVDDI